MKGTMKKYVLTAVILATCSLHAAETATEGKTFALMVGISGNIRSCRRSYGCSIRTA